MKAASSCFRIFKDSTYCEVLSQEHPALDISRKHVAWVYQSRRHYSKAEPLCVESLEMTKRLFGQELPEVATALNDFGNLYMCQGRYNEAESLHMECLAMQKRLPGHP